MPQQLTLPQQQQQQQHQQHQPLNFHLIQLQLITNYFLNIFVPIREIPPLLSIPQQQQQQQQQQFVQQFK